MSTYWNAEVAVDGACKVSTGDVSLGKTLELAMSDAIYYQAIYPGSKVTIKASEACACCYNAGTVNRNTGRTFKTIKCPSCKGKIPTGKLDEFALVMPDPANHIFLRLEEPEATCTCHPVVADGQIFHHADCKA